MQAVPVFYRLLAQQGRRLSSHHSPALRTPSMNELPVPRGSWQAQYDRNQKKYNAVLALGIAFCAASITIARSSGLLYLNFSPPKTLD